MAMLHLDKALYDESSHRLYQTTSLLIKIGRLTFEPLQNGARLRYIMTRKPTGCLEEGGVTNRSRASLRCETQCLPSCGGANRDHEVREGNVVGRKHRVDGVFPPYGGTTRGHETMKRGLSLVLDNVRDLFGDKR